MYKLFRFPYSNYSHKVQKLLGILSVEFEVVDVPYTQRDELASLTNGRIMVPALVHAHGMLVESKAICVFLMEQHQNELIPKGKEAAIWAYSDWSDTILEDVLFRIATPGIHDKFQTLTEQGLFKLNKERRYGDGSVDEWRINQDKLLDRARELFESTIMTLSRHTFVMGDAITYADISLYGHLAMVNYADAHLLERISSAVSEYFKRVGLIGKA